MAQLRVEGLGHLPVVVGGAIRPFDIPALEAAGVRAVFRGGESLETIAGTFRSLALPAAARP
jgi:methylmalonyl-CoA mutase cobalamin-binding subunit